MASKIILFLLLVTAYFHTIACVLAANSGRDWPIRQNSFKSTGPNNAAEYPLKPPPTKSKSFPSSSSSVVPRKMIVDVPRERIKGLLFNLFSFLCDFFGYFLIFM
jgi:hypothetical protein